ncbi:type VI secretion system-associated protein TagF [Szabonella alba]|uniref:Type VI secretion system-associated protein TagF n=1 Tax=Szabonella alba TaxID=2804194 RepID=A0A8K0Y196_9RHOB|nr:type VI secretion system-associated protein TagF [Szabonella alba]MBL4919080.1 type VI secretion system-associated protein TagF [Szabonella alba]
MVSRFGAFGKLPALGDFLRMDLAAGFIDPWDRWLQEGLVMARGALGGAWQEAYFSAPIWRFNLGPGLCGAAPVTGVMMSSVDRVGRQFPLTLASPMPDGNSPILDHFLSVPMFEALDEIALAALEDDMTKDLLRDRLATLSLPQMPTHITVLPGQGGLVVKGAAQGQLVPELAASLVAQDFRKPSVWSAETADGMRMMVCEGLPAAGQMIGLFDMDAKVWQRMETE